MFEKSITNIFTRINEKVAQLLEETKIMQNVINRRLYRIEHLQAERMKLYNDSLNYVEEAGENVSFFRSERLLKELCNDIVGYYALIKQCSDEIEIEKKTVLKEYRDVKKHIRKTKIYNSCVLLIAKVFTPKMYKQLMERMKKEII